MHTSKFAIFGQSTFSLVFGLACGFCAGGEMYVDISNVVFNHPGTTYRPGPLSTG